MEEFYEGKSKPVNLELQQIMVQLDYIEQTGHGVPLIVSKYGKEVFDITENFITVTIPLNHKRNVESSFSKTGTRVLDRNDDKILELMKENANISVSEISRRVELGTTAITKRILSEKNENGNRNPGLILTRGLRRFGRRNAMMGGFFFRNDKRGE